MLKARLSSEGLYLLDTKPTAGQSRGPLVIHDNLIGSHGLVAGDDSFKFLPYQLSMVG